MNRLRAPTAVIFSFLCSMTCPSYAQDWYAGVGIGLFDVDRLQDSSDEFAAHFESAAYNVFVGYGVFKYIDVEMQFEWVNKGSSVDPDGFRSSFKGFGITPSVLAKLPLPQTSIEAYLRLGATYLGYEAANISLGGKIEESDIQLSYGAGFRAGKFFVEYVNYNKRQGMFMEQVRAGFRLKF